jgi:hypothetical protein
LKRALEKQESSIIAAYLKDATIIKVEMICTNKPYGHKPKSTQGMNDPDSFTGCFLF